MGRGSGKKDKVTSRSHGNKSNADTEQRPAVQDNADGTGVDGAILAQMCTSAGIMQAQILIMAKLEQLLTQNALLASQCKVTNENVQKFETRFKIIWDRMRKGQGHYVEDIGRIAQVTALSSAEPNETEQRVLTPQELIEAFAIRDKCEAKSKELFGRVRDTFRKERGQTYVKCPTIVCVKSQGWTFWPAQIIIGFTAVPLDVLYHYREDLAGVITGKHVMVRWLKEILYGDEEAKSAAELCNYFFVSHKNRRLVQPYECMREELVQKSKVRRKGFSMESAIEKADRMMEQIQGNKGRLTGSCITLSPDSELNPIQAMELTKRSDEPKSVAHSVQLTARDRK